MRAKCSATGTPQELLARTETRTLEAAFIALLPPAQREGYRPVTIPPRATTADGEAAIEARDLTMRLGDFVAVDHVSFRIARGEIFGFLGSNGCGKTTTMKMLTSPAWSSCLASIHYVILAMLNFLLLTALAVTVFGVPLKGSFPTLAAGALLYVIAATAIGLLISTFMRSQIATLFGAAVLTILPAVQFSGMINPVSSLEGAGALIGAVYPTTHFLTIARGAFSKGLAFADLQAPFVPLLIAVPVLISLGAALLKKQDR